MNRFYCAVICSLMASQGGDNKPLGVGELSRRIHGIDWTEPAPELPLRAEDLSKYPRESFSISYALGNGLHIDGLGGLATKDMVCDPDTTVPFEFAPAELDTLYRMVIAMRFFDLPEPSPARNQSITMLPGNQVWLKVWAGGQLKALSWHSHQPPAAEARDDWKRIYDLTNTVRAMVERNPEYRRLPRPRCGYL